MFSSNTYVFVYQYILVYVFNIQIHLDVILTYTVRNGFSFIFFYINNQLSISHFVFHTDLRFCLYNILNFYFQFDVFLDFFSFLVAISINSCVYNEGFIIFFILQQGCLPCSTVVLLTVSLDINACLFFQIKYIINLPSSGEEQYLFLLGLCYIHKVTQEERTFSRC